MKQTSPTPSKGSSSLAAVHEDAAALDIGAREIYACVPKEREEQNVRAFGTFTADLHQLADWLVRCQIKSVAMESTGVYWVPIFEILEACGIEVYLVDARQLKQVPGRKSDVADCQWIQQLHTYGLLRRCFQAEEEMRALRILVRQRESILRCRSTHILHLQKALQMMNLQLMQVVSDITGESGLRILRAILAGERNPQQLASLRDGRCAHSQEEIAKALQGSYKAEHLFALRQALEAYDFYQEQIRACDEEMRKLYEQMMPPPDAPTPSTPPPLKKRSITKNRAHFDLSDTLYRLVGVDLTAITGLNALSVQAILGETGLDMAHWPTVKHFCSWLGVAPRHEKSGGKMLHNRTLKTSNRANNALRMAAQSAGRTNTAIGAFYRRLKAKHGPAKANVATAHKLARILYTMLKTHQPFEEVGVEAYTQQQKERVMRSLTRKAKAVGMMLVPCNSEGQTLPSIAT